MLHGGVTTEICGCNCFTRTCKEMFSYNGEFSEVEGEHALSHGLSRRVTLNHLSEKGISQCELVYKTRQNSVPWHLGHAVPDRPSIQIPSIRSICTPSSSSSPHCNNEGLHDSHRSYHLGHSRRHQRCHRSMLTLGRHHLLRTAQLSTTGWKSRRLPPQLRGDQFLFQQRRSLERRLHPAM
jgi:hypothetical protein